jgi:hypothetical protein
MAIYKSIGYVLMAISTAQHTGYSNQIGCKATVGLFMPLEIIGIAFFSGG